MKRFHGNSHQNSRKHHLYEIWDTEEEDVFKYGISDKPIGEDGLSKRIRDQVNLFNRVVNYIRFVGRILVKNIPGRKKAEELEKETIETYRKKYGRKPRGNIK